MKVPGLRRITGLSACVALFVAIGGSAGAAAPPPSAPVVNPPNSVAVLGDSMSVATGINAIPSITSPEHSWATGNNATVNSVWTRLKALSPSAARKNQAANGKRVVDIPGQAAGIDTDTRLVLIQIGGNDLCRDTVADMTSVADYRSLFSDSLDAIEQRAPNALVMVSSIPDIWNLWFLRGAPNPPNPTPSSRAGTASLFWDTLAVVPCKSLVKAPTDMSPEAVQRRADVRQRNIDFNNAQLEECSQRLRCLTDSFSTFKMSSNRASLWGDILPPADWEFVDNDISTVDHFHPGISGQEKLARTSWESGFNYAESTPPTRSSQSILPAPSGGVNWSPVVAKATWSDSGSDSAGVKGIEYRIHHGGSAGSWQSSLATPIPPVGYRDLYTYPTQHSVSVPISASGVSYLETRAMDRNGNLSGSQFTEVNIDTAAIPTPTIATGPPALSGSRSAAFTFTGLPAGVAGANYECSLDGGSFAACSTPYSIAGGLADGAHSLRVRIASADGNGAAAQRDWTVAATPPPAPDLDSGPAALINQDSASVAFSGAAAGGFECSLNQAAFTACTSPLELSGLSQGTHNLRVRQLNEAGVAGSAVTHEWQVDTVAPDAPSLSGAPNGLTKLNVAAISFSGEPGASFECSLGDAAFAACASPHLLSQLADGETQFRVRQTDEAGNVGPEVEAHWTIDATAPSAPEISDAPQGLVRSTDATIGLTTESEAVVECRLNGGDWAPCTSPWIASGLGQGPQTFEARQTDQAGNVSPAVAATWTVDTVAPKLKRKPKVKAKGKARKGKARRYVISSAFVAAKGKPASIEYSTAKKKPRVATPAKARTRKWVRKVKVKSKRKPTWVRVGDAAGNWSGWVRLR